MIEREATEASEHYAAGTVFFLYCPFSDARLERVLDALESIAMTRPIRICCVDLPLPPRSWLSLAVEDLNVTVHRGMVEPRG